MSRAQTRRARDTEREQQRTERRDALLVLLARADRGVLSRDEAGRLRTLVETELGAGDAARRVAGGQQAAAHRAQQRLDAAEQAIRETEAERDRLGRHVTTLHDKLDAAGRAALDVRTHHRAELAEVRRLVEVATARAENTEQLRVGEAANALRFANYLADAQRACGAADWPTLPEQVRALANRAHQAEQQLAASLRALCAGEISPQQALADTVEERVA